MVRYLLIALLFVLIFWAIWAIKDEIIDRKLKVIITIFLVSFFAFAYFYQSDFNDESEKNMQILTYFKQGKSINCLDYNVSNVKFNYEFGTSCFVAKREFKELSGVIIPISKCKYE